MKIVIESVTNVSEEDARQKGRHVAGRTPILDETNPDIRRAYLQLYIPADHADFDRFKVGQEIEL
jgi:hypothetical protein